MRAENANAPSVWSTEGAPQNSGKIDEQREDTLPWWLGQPGDERLLRAPSIELVDEVRCLLGCDTRTAKHLLGAAESISGLCWHVQQTAIRRRFDEMCALVQRAQRVGPREARLGALQVLLVAVQVDDLTLHDETVLLRLASGVVATLRRREGGLPC